MVIRKFILKRITLAAQKNICVASFFLLYNVELKIYNTKS